MTTPIWKDIFVAALSNDLDSVKYFIETQGVPITATDEDAKTVALIAAEHGRMPVLRYILDKNASLLRVSDIYGNTVLNKAIERRDLEMVKYLVEERGADIYEPNSRLGGNTAIHVAAQKGAYDIFEYFTEVKYADVNLRNFNGEPPLFSAAEKPYMHIIKYLIEERHADPTVMDLDNHNILFKSARRGDLMLPKYLFEKRNLSFDVNWIGAGGYTVVNLASRYNKVGFVNYMIVKQNASIFIPDTLNRTPLHYAAAGGFFHLCKLLVEKGASYDAKDVYGHTPFQLGSDEQVRKLFFLKKVKSRNTETMQRDRRSVPSSWIEPQKDYKSRFEGLPGHDFSRVDISPSMLSSFLFLVDTITRYVRGSFHNALTQPALLSPRELLRLRIDPVAIEAVKGISDLEDHKNAD